MKVLELFSGTGSVGKCCKELGYETLSLDIDGRADINMSILDWDYKAYPRDEFDIIWASPPCATFSNLQYSNVGRKVNGEILTRDKIQENMIAIGDPLVKKALEIIKYFNPPLWFLENPNTGRLKEREYMSGIPYYIVDYCMYCQWGYRKRTRIWTNKCDWEAKVCDGKGTCGNMVGDKRMKHRTNVSGDDTRTCLDDRYRIPEDLIYSLLLE